MAEERMGDSLREAEQEPRRRHWLPPCPSYDVDGMEQWLGDRAREGWLLEKDGFFAGVASFVESTPCAARYRLEAALKDTSIWAENSGEPSPEALAISERYAWEYVGKRGSFFIYRTLEPGARELNTDPAVQALAIAAVQKRQMGGIISSFFWGVVYLVMLLRVGILLTMVSVGSCFFLFTAALVLWMLGSSLAEVVSMGRLKRRLRAGTPAPPVRRRPAVYFAGKALLTVACVAWLCILLYRWGVSATDEDKMSLEAYGRRPPFATLTDFAGEGARGYRSDMPGTRFNYVKVWSDPLAPENITWAEHAGITRADGSVLDGGLYVYYHKAANRWIAGRLARSYLRAAQSKKGYEAAALPALDVDFAAAFYDGLGWPNIVVQRGEVVCQVTLYETGDGPYMTLEEWAAAFVQSLPEPEKE